MLRVGTKPELGEPTPVFCWVYGDCGRSEDGAVWCRVANGAIRIGTDGSVRVVLASELNQLQDAACPDPDLHVDITISK